MAKITTKGATYEVIPVRLAVTLSPVFSADLISAKRIRVPFPVSGAESEMMKLADIQSQTENLLRKHWQRYNRGIRRRAVQGLLDVSPEFKQVPWVADAILHFKELSLTLRNRGWPKSKYEFLHPLVLVGLVNHLKKSRQAANTDQALWKLEELNLGLSYDAIKAAYYRALRNPEVSAIFVEHPAEASLPSPEQIETVDRRIHDEGIPQEQQIRVVNMLAKEGETLAKFKLESASYPKDGEWIAVVTGINLIQRA